jgi:type IV secretory pathway VirJ component
MSSNPRTLRMAGCLLHSRLLGQTFLCYPTRMRYKLSILVMLFGAASGAPAMEETLSFERFGTVYLYHQSPQPPHVALFVSGDGGWNQGVVDMARDLADLETLVVGIDIRPYLEALTRTTEPCLYPAEDFEALSKFVQKKLGYPAYTPPVLVGYSSGATLVYATAVQAPPNTFRGAISLGFCPDLLLTKPLCRGNGLEWQAGPKGKGFVFLPATTLEIPWIALQGTIDQVCDVTATEAYVRKVRNGELVLLPKVGHGYAVPRNWLPQFRQAFAKIVAEKPSSRDSAGIGALADLPLIEVKPVDPIGNALAIIISGDGGWGVTDRGIANGLAQKGIPAVGWNSLHYFWNAKTPAKAAQDLERVLRSYLAAWRLENAVIVGYSLGADVAPFMISRLPGELQSKIRAVVLLGPSSTVDFEFHLTDWLMSRQRPTSLPVRPEIAKLDKMRVFCIFGKGDSDAICGSTNLSHVTAIEIAGGHRVGREYQPVVDVILKAIR